MSLNAKNSKNSGGGGGAEPLEAGAYAARIVSVTDIGLQPQMFNGEEKKPAYMIMVTYELVDEFMKGEDGEDLEDKPRWVSEQFALYSLEVENAKSTKRYNALDPDMEFDGEWTGLIGMPCHVTLTRTPGKGANKARIYNNVASVSKMRERDAKKCEPLINEPYFFDMDNPDAEVWNMIPAWVRTKIVNSLEFADSPTGKLVADSEGSGSPTKEKTSTGDVDEDEIPY